MSFGSNDATVKFGYDGTALNAGLKDGERRLNQFSASAERSMSRVSRASAADEKLARASGARIANISMQMQDIAVTAEMGMSASRIMMQQGTQILAALGTAGAVTGGVMALGLALYEAKKSGDEAFAALKKEMGDFDKTMRRTRAGGLSAMLEGIDDLKKRAKQLNEEVESGFFKKREFKNGEWSVVPDERDKKRQEFAFQIEKERKQLIQDAAQASDDELRILKLKLDGQDEEAAKLERQIKLQKTLVAIEDVKVFALRQKLTANAIEAERVESAAAARASKAKAQAEEDALDKKRESIRLSRMDVEILELQARGQDRKLKKIQEQAFIERRAHEFSAQGLDANASIELAKREWAAREAIDRRLHGRRGHIRGVTARHEMGGGLDEFERLQRISTYKLEKSLIPGDPNDPRRVFVPQFSDSMMGPKRGRMMGEPIGPLSRPRPSSIDQFKQRQAQIAATPQRPAENLTPQLEKIHQVLQEIKNG